MGYEPEQLSWLSQPEFKNCKGCAYSAVILWDNNCIRCIKLLSHLVGREDKEKERARGETTEDQREKRVVVACVPVCVRACVWQFHWYSFTETGYRDSKLDTGEDRTSQNILSKSAWDKTQQFTEKPRDARLSQVGEWDCTEATNFQA